MGQIITTQNLVATKVVRLAGQQPHFSRLCANFTWTLNTIYSTGGLPYWEIQRYEVKYGICYISAKNGPIATKRKANISIEL